MTGKPKPQPKRRAGRPRSHEPATVAGLMLLKWGSAHEPGALVIIADKCSVHVRTVMRWIPRAPNDMANCPNVLQAMAMLDLCGIPLEAWAQAA